MKMKDNQRRAMFAKKYYKGRDIMSLNSITLSKTKKKYFVEIENPMARSRFPFEREKDAEAYFNRRKRELISKERIL